jgi:hypothetical protein
VSELEKMCKDLSIVMQKYIVDAQKDKENAAPIKILRSVGLQVEFYRNR